MCGQKMNKTGILSEIEANAFAFAFFEVMFVVLYDKNNAFAQIEKIKRTANRYCDSHYSRLAGNSTSGPKA